jgi:hypothetical protein
MPATSSTPQELGSNRGAAQKGRDYASWKGPSNFDYPHRFVASYVYELPFGRGRQMLRSGVWSYIVGGFRTSGVYTFASGRPFTVNSGSALNNAIDPFGAATAVPLIVGIPHVVGDVNCWYYASKNSACQPLASGLSDAFQLQPAGTFGNAGRNILRGPPTSVFDFALMRDSPVDESLGLQFCCEVFHLTNTALFGRPNNNFSSSAAGAITTVSGDPRVMQNAARLKIPIATVLASVKRGRMIVAFKPSLNRSK